MIGTKTRILHVTHNMDVGGTEQVIRQIVIASDKRQFESSIVCIDGSVGPVGRSLQLDDVTVNSISRSAGFDRQTIKTLRALIRSNRIDVLHCHQYTPFCYGAFAAIGLGVKVVFTEHGRFHPDRYTWKRRIVNQLLYRLADHITCISNATRVALDHYEWIPEKRVQVIYNGVQTPVSAPNSQSIRSTLGISNSAFVLGTISRFDPIKNQTMMLEALSRLREKHPECVLIMAGDGSERTSLENTACELGIEDGVYFTGFITDIAAHLDAIDIFLLTSFSEGTSMTLLEAMSVGKVVVATAVGGNVEVIENGRTGMLVPSGDVDALVNRLLLLHDSAPERLRFSEGAIRGYSDRFSADLMVDHYEALYRGVKVMQ